MEKTLSELKAVLTIVDGHVKFSETKNAALFAVACAIAATVFQAFVDGKPADLLLCIYLWVLFGGLAAAAVFTLLSFLPQTHIPWIVRKRSVSEFDDLLFFGDIQKYDEQGYIAALAAAVGEPVSTPPRLMVMYAEQVIVNALIASRKFTYFKYAIWAALFGALTPPVAAIVLWLFHDSHDV